MKSVDQLISFHTKAIQFTTDKVSLRSAQTNVSQFDLFAEIENGRQSVNL
jgi:hypothetical protein